MCLQAERADACIVDLQVLEAPAHLLAGQGPVAEASLCGAHGLDGKHRVEHAAVVEHLAHVLAPARALALVMHVGHQVAMHAGGFGAVLQRQRVVAHRIGPGGLHVLLGAGPPHAVHLLARVAHGHRLAYRDGVHRAPSPQEHEVGAFLAHLQPGGLLLEAGRSDRQRGEVEAIAPRQFLEDANGLPAIRRVVVDQRDLPALEPGRPHFAGHVLDQHLGRIPVGAHQREIPGEGAAVLRLGTTVAHGDQGNLVAPAPSRSGQR